MSPTIGLVANIYNEANALPGWLETHLPFFDDVRVVHAGPRGEYSTDGTVELLERWRVPVLFTSIDDGFGAVRTMAIRYSPCDYVMILDADERFYPIHRMMRCRGDDTPREQADAILRQYDPRDPKVKIPWDQIGMLGADLRVEQGEVYDQGAWLRSVLATNPDAVATVRRHWHGLSMRSPTQNWEREPDWQMRVVRNHDSIGFDPGTKMHEKLCGVDRIFRADMERGPFFEHFHFTFKRMEEGQRAHDVDTYDKIHAGGMPLTQSEFNKLRSGQ